MTKNEQNREKSHGNFSTIAGNLHSISIIYLVSQHAQKEAEDAPNETPPPALLTGHAAPKKSATKPPAKPENRK
jgi:hypothetical protein